MTPNASSQFVLLLQSDLDVLTLWNIDWKLMFNEMNILWCPSFPMPLPIIVIPRRSISSTGYPSPHVTNKKTLEYIIVIIISSNLSWSHHISCKDNFQSLQKYYVCSVTHLHHLTTSPPRKALHLPDTISTYLWIPSLETTPTKRHQPN